MNNARAAVPRSVIYHMQLQRLAENLRARHNLDRPWHELSWQDQQDWLIEARRLLRGTGIEVRGA